MFYCDEPHYRYLILYPRRTLRTREEGSTQFGEYSMMPNAIHITSSRSNPGRNLEYLVLQ